MGRHAELITRYRFSLFSPTYVRKIDAGFVLKAWTPAYVVTCVVAVVTIRVGSLRKIR